MGGLRPIMTQTQGRGCLMMMVRMNRFMAIAARCGASAAILLGSASLAHPASVTNKDEQAHTLIVTAQGVRSELVISPGETVTLCNDGCFLTLPNGDRAALIGSETVEIVSGAAIIN